MTRKQTVSLCMIVKNEEACLKRCIDSFKDLIDEVIIVDTGSTDQTVKIAKELGAIVKHFEWNKNFADARNYSLSFATKDWILVVDADEYLRVEDRELLIETLNDTQYDTYFIKTLNFSQPNDKSSCIINLNHRIFKNNKGFYFDGAIHEQLKYPENVAYKITDIGLYHTGYLGKAITGKDKSKRNIEILNEVLAENPNNAFHQFNIANDYFQEGNYTKAIEFYNKAYQNSNYSQGHMPKLVIFRINAYVANRQPEEALKCAEDGLKKYPGYTHLMYLKGNIEEELGLAIKAMNSYKKCIKMGPPAPEFEFVAGSSSSWPYLKLAKLLKDHREYDEAFKYYNQYLTLEPSRYIVLYEVIECLKNSNLASDVIVSYLEKYLTHQNLQTMIVKVDILIRNGLFERAQTYLDKMILEETSSTIIHMYARNQFYLKNYKESMHYFLKYSEKNDFNDCAVYCYLIFLLIDEPNLSPEVKKYPEPIHFLERCFKYKDNEHFSSDLLPTIMTLLDECLKCEERELFESFCVQLESIENSDLWEQLVSFYLKKGVTEKAQELLLKLILNEKELSQSIFNLMSKL